MTGAAEADGPDRSVSPYTLREKVMRVLWAALGRPAFALTFHNMYGARAAILRLFGATVGRRTRIRPSARIEQPWNLTVGDNSSIGDRAIVYCLGPVTLGSNVSISQMAHLCAGTHDFTKPGLPLLRPPIVVEDEVWIAGDAFIGPGVRVARGCVVGARSSVYKDTEPWKIYAGNPARPIKDRPFPGAPTPGRGSDG